MAVQEYGAENTRCTKVMIESRGRSSSDDKIGRKRRWIRQCLSIEAGTRSRQKQQRVRGGGAQKR